MIKLHRAMDTYSSAFITGDVNSLILIFYYNCKKMLRLRGIRKNVWGFPVYLFATSWESKIIFKLLFFLI